MSLLDNEACTLSPDTQLYTSFSHAALNFSAFFTMPDRRTTELRPEELPIEVLAVQSAWSELTDTEQKCATVFCCNTQVPGTATG